MINALLRNRTGVAASQRKRTAPVGMRAQRGAVVYELELFVALGSSTTSSASALRSPPVIFEAVSFRRRNSRNLEKMRNHLRIDGKPNHSYATAVE